MIEHLFISKVRVKLLRLFYTDPSVEYHIRGTVRKLKEEINAVRRELMNLEQGTVLKHETRGNRIFYSADPKSPLYYEVLGLVHKSTGLGQVILESLDKIGPVVFALITTAYIENHHPSQYDVDLLLVGDLNMKAVSTAIKEAETVTGREIRYTIIPEDEFAFRKKKRDSFIINIINKHNIILVGDENKLLA